MELWLNQWENPNLSEALQLKHTSQDNNRLILKHV